MLVHDRSSLALTWLGQPSVSVLAGHLDDAEVLAGGPSSS